MLILCAAFAVASKQTQNHFVFKPMHQDMQQLGRQMCAVTAALDLHYLLILLTFNNYCNSYRTVRLRITFCTRVLLNKGTYLSQIMIAHNAYF